MSSPPLKNAIGAALKAAVDAIALELLDTVVAVVLLKRASPNQNT
jgi:hypothetical protein